MLLSNRLSSIVLGRCTRCSTKSSRDFTTSSAFDNKVTLDPESRQLAWKFSQSPKSFWQDLDNQKKFIDWASKIFNIKDVSDWYNVSQKNIKEIGGTGLLSLFNNSTTNLLSTVYREHEWLPWKFRQCSRFFWEDISNQKRFLDWVAKQLNIKDMSDWYNVSQKELIDFGGGGLLNRYNFTTLQLLMNVYPDYEWLPWKFTRTSVTYLDDINNQRKFVSWLEKEMNIKEMSDWYKITTKEIIDIGGAGLFHKYNCSLIQLLSTIYPDYNWLPWKFTRTSSTYWEDLNGQKQFMGRIAKQLKVKDMSDWHKVSEKDIIDYGGGFLLVKYRSLSQLLSVIYPEYEWNDTKFVVKSSIWNNEMIANYYVEWLKTNSSAKELLYLQKMMETMEVEEESVLRKTISKAYSQFEPKSYKKGSKKSQFILKETLKLLFYGEEVLEDFKHPDIVLSSGPLELDFYYPQYNLAFEYQGQQHYRDIAKFNRKESLGDTKHRDMRKESLCKEKGITLIEVPYWWDRKFTSLYATVYNHRPELLPAPPTGNPIPFSPPTKTQQINTTTSKKVVMTATEWDDSSEPMGWWMTEKYDGVRLYWDGSQFYTRHGEKIYAPKSITSQLPPVALDGELWTRYGLFQEAVLLCKSTNEEKWKQATFIVFDSPSIADKPFEERIQHLNSLTLPPFVKVIEPVKCAGREHLKEYFAQIISKGGEGVMLRESESLYKSGRSNSLKKFKPYFDTEVKVLKNQYPHGFLCQQINGKSLFVNIRSNENNPELKKVKTGTVITVKYLGTNVHGTLQYPQFYRERNDVSWENLIKS